MEIPAQCVCHAKLPNPNPKPPCIFPSTSSLFASSNSVLHLSNKKCTLTTQLQGLQIRPKQLKNFGVVFANSETQTPPADVADRWLLEPVGDGDTRHIGFKVEMPNAFEIVSNEVTVGRVPEKADMVIPVATVSGAHARIRKKEGTLYVTDLDSTNGTFIDEKRLRPGVAAPVSPGSCVTFGDIHLAIFRVSKLENTVEAGSSSEGSKQEETDGTATTPTGNT
ncbi:hypothetical protein UlMin_012509 [Ulmus minor]